MHFDNKKNDALILGKNGPFNATVFILRVNETWFLVRHESCECKLNRVDRMKVKITVNEKENYMSSEQKWNHHECRYEFKELDNWGSFKHDYIWNLSTCICEC